MTENGNRYVTNRWLIWVLAGLIFAASGIIVADTRSGISKAQTAVECLQKDKLDKDIHYRDMSEIKETMKAIDLKIDRLLWRKNGGG
jgi:hypothetical protein